MILAEKFTYMMQGIMLCFFIFAFCIMYAIKNKNRLQKLLTYSMLFWAITSAKDIIYMDPAIHENSYITNILLWIDMFGIPLGFLFLTEATNPGWVTVKRSIYTLVPPIIWGIAYIASANSLVFELYLYYSMLFGITTVAVIIFDTFRYNRYIRDNYSYSENIDLKWIRHVSILLLVCLTTWTITSLKITYYGDVFYYISSLSIWILVFYHARNQIIIPITIKDNKFFCNSDAKETDKSFSTTSLSSLAKLLRNCMEHNKLYNNPKLCLNDVAEALGTNRTYLSNCINNELHSTFFDYINALRVENACILLATSNDTLEEISEQCGFNSLSTFYRTFAKTHNCTPAKYRNQLKSSQAV